MPTTQNTEKLITNFSRLYILTILYEQPQHGYAIINTYKQRTSKQISPSTVYPFLKQLEKKGYLTHSLKPIGTKKKKIFTLTIQGVELCRQLFKRFSTLVSVAIESSLTTCAHCGCKIFEGGHYEDISGKKMLFCCVHCANSYRRFVV